MKKYLPILFASCVCLIPILGFLLLFLTAVYMLHIESWFQTFLSICFPIVNGILFALFLQPILDRLEKHLSIKLSVMILYFGLLFLIILCILAFIPIILDHGNYIRIQLPIVITKVKQLFHTYVPNIEEFQIWDYISMDQIYTIFLRSFRKIGNFFVNAGISIVVAFFVSNEILYIKRLLKQYIKQWNQVSMFYQTVSKIVYEYLYGTFVDMIFIVVSMGIVLGLAKFPHPIFYAILLAFLNLLPYIGATIGFLMVLLTAVGYYEQLPWILLLILWCIQQIEANLVQPYIFHKTMHVHPLLAFLFFFISEKMFGVIGMLLSPIFASLAQIVIRSYRHVKEHGTMAEWEDVWEDFDTCMEKDPT